MKCMHPLHFWSPFGSVWYCTLACDTFAGAAGAPESVPVAGGLSGAAASGLGGGVAEPALGAGALSGAAPVDSASFFPHPNSAAGASRPRPTASAPRSMSLRDGVSPFIMSSSMRFIFSDSFPQELTHGMAAELPPPRHLLARLARSALPL
jgi:hypothetical protein